MDANLAARRNDKGRFAPGCSGNPAGKCKGTRNRATILAEALRDGEGEAVARIVIDRALSGDAVAARFCLSLLSPKPRGRAVTLDLPEGSRPGDVVAAFNVTLAAMAAGEITPDEALVITRVLDGRLRALKAWQLEESLTSYDRTIPGDEVMLDGEMEEEELSSPDDEESATDPVMSPHPAPVFAEAPRVMADLPFTCISPASDHHSPSPPLGGEGRGEGDGAAFPSGPERSHPADRPLTQPSPRGGEGFLNIAGPPNFGFPAFHLHPRPSRRAPELAFPPAMRGPAHQGYGLPSCP